MSREGVSQHASSRTTEGLTGGRSERGEDEKNGEVASLPLCDALTKYIESAKQKFSSLKGTLTYRGSSTSYRPKNDARDYHQCEVNFYSDAEPSLTCNPEEDDLEKLFEDVKACIPTWSETHKTYTTLEEYELDGPDGVAVRLRKREGRQIVLWVDAAPPRLIWARSPTGTPLSRATK